MKSLGYVGFGEVTGSAVMGKDFVDPTTGKKLADLPLKEPRILHDADDPDLADWVVAVAWKKTFPREQAKTFLGVFANQNIVCKLRHPETVEFLQREFGV